MDNSLRERIGQTAVDLYLETGKPVRPLDIAARLGVTLQKVQKAIRDDSGFVVGCSYHEVELPTYSKSYRGMQHGTVKAAAYLPDRETLRKLIIGKK